MLDQIEVNPELQPLDPADYYRALLRYEFNTSRGLHGHWARAGDSVKVPRALKRELKFQRKRTNPKHLTRFLERARAAFIQLGRDHGGTMATYLSPDLEPRHDIAPLERKRLAFHLYRMASEVPDGIPAEDWAKIMRGELESITLDWVRVIEYEFPILTTILNKPRDLFNQPFKSEGWE